MHVSELRLVVTADDYDGALAFYRDALGLPVVADYSSAEGRATLLDVGRARLELFDGRQAEHIDRVEVGRRVAGHIRVALEVDDAAVAADRAATAGAEVLAAPTRTPWGSLNARLEAPAGLQLTLFSDEPEA
ncbi:VOC family protein [Motilibacter deserti]|uniref:VOC family protein n=1 Tax=Motilibacter deserti TaxID=2714956 RepID=UPI0038B2B379